MYNHNLSLISRGLGLHSNEDRPILHSKPVFIGNNKR
jgi:hypothetical protein